MSQSFGSTCYLLVLVVLAFLISSESYPATTTRCIGDMSEQIASIMATLTTEEKIPKENDIIKANCDIDNLMTNTFGDHWRNDFSKEDLKKIDGIKFCSTRPSFFSPALAVDRQKICNKKFNVKEQPKEGLLRGTVNLAMTRLANIRDRSSRIENCPEELSKEKSSELIPNISLEDAHGVLHVDADRIHNIDKWFEDYSKNPINKRKPDVVTDEYDIILPDKVVRDQEHLIGLGFARAKKDQTLVAAHSIKSTCFNVRDVKSVEKCLKHIPERVSKDDPNANSIKENRIKKITSYLNRGIISEVDCENPRPPTQIRTNGIIVSRIKRGDMIQRIFYKSLSDGDWRSSPVVEGGKFSKMDFIENHHYVQTSKISDKIASKLEDKTIVPLRSFTEEECKITFISKAKNEHPNESATCESQTLLAVAQSENEPAASIYYCSPIETQGIYKKLQLTPEKARKMKASIADGADRNVTAMEPNQCADYLSYANMLPFAELSTIFETVGDGIRLSAKEEITGTAIFQQQDIKCENQDMIPGKFKEISKLTILKECFENFNNYPKGFIPKKMSKPVCFRQKKHSLLGDITIYEYRAQIPRANAVVDIIWKIAATNMKYPPDDEPKVWIENIIVAGDGISSFGTYKHPLNAAFLTSKPIDYKEQVPEEGVGEDGERYCPSLPGDQSNYCDLTPLLKSLIPIKKFLKSQKELSKRKQKGKISPCPL
ncbi:MAG: hypothetical protein HQK52_23715 [Oligoflexia bacterium]|nr:hypothetical protein [Oligoflexia bacterium]